jgi:hypothetical protein
MKRLTWLLLLLPLFAICGCSEINLHGGLNQIKLAIYTPLCIDVEEASTAAGARVQAYPCGDSKRSQEWDVKPLSLDLFGQVTIMNANSQMCMTVLSGPNNPDSAPGQLIVQEPCADDASQQNQLWTISTAPGGEEGVRVISVASSQCLDLPYGAVASIFFMQQYTCTANDPAQGWTFSPVSLGSAP